MYNTQNIATKIKEELKIQHVTSKKMLTDLGMGINAISELSKGKQMSCLSLALIADYLNCSVDYLLGRTSKKELSDADSSNEDFMKLISLMSELPPEKIAILLERVRLLNSQRDQ